MIFSSFSIEPKNPQAPGGVGSLRLTFKLPAKETIHAIGFFVVDALVGSVADKAGLKSGVYDVKCDFTKLGDGPQLVVAKVYRMADAIPGSTLVYESGPI